MPKNFRKEFKTGKIIAHVRKKNNDVYEIRCQINGNRIEVSSKNLATAKAKFIVKLNQLSEKETTTKPVTAEETTIAVEKPVTLTEYMQTWLEKVKNPLLNPLRSENTTISSKTTFHPSWAKRQ